mmetsp:Transcript_25025/g.69736  ORF Transcript_25025/g.69736 Transcript_25025/m.69736 type:complete len:335 (-) Transcript_25025:362-1366(-)
MFHCGICSLSLKEDRKEWPGDRGSGRAAVSRPNWRQIWCCWPQCVRNCRTLRLDGLCRIGVAVDSLAVAAERTAAMQLHPCRLLGQVRALVHTVRWRRLDQRQGNAHVARRLRVLHHDVAMALQLHCANVLETTILQELGKLRIPEHSLAELNLEMRAEETFDVGQRDHAWPLRGGRVLQDQPQVDARFVPLRQWERPRGESSRPLACAMGPFVRAPFLHHRLGATVRHHGAAVVSEDSFLGNGELNDVAHLAQGAVRQERQLPLHQSLRTRVPSSRQLHLLGGHALEVGPRLVPQRLRVDVRGTVNVHELLCPSDDHRRPISSLLVHDAQLGR